MNLPNMIVIFVSFLKKKREVEIDLSFFMGIFKKTLLYKNKEYLDIYNFFYIGGFPCI